MSGRVVPSSRTGTGKRAPRFAAVSLAAFLALTVPAGAETRRASSIDHTLSSTEQAAVALARHAFNANRLRSALSAGADRRLALDRGEITILEDDGTLVMPFNQFDLSNGSLRFRPLETGYSVQVGDEGLAETGGGSTPLPLSDDDSASVDLPFPFPFYGISHRRLFVNTDGNITFDSGDSESTARSLGRIVAGPPRISPFFNDLLPTGHAAITVEAMSDRLIVAWRDIGEFDTPDVRNTFQAILYSDGAIDFRYGTVPARGAVVGLGPGPGAEINLLDLSLLTEPLASSGIVAEVLASKRQLDLPAIAKRFYETHRDHFDALFVFADFDIDLDAAFAFQIGIRNDVEGIDSRDSAIFDFGSEFGSPARLSGMVNAGSIGNYPLNPYFRFLGTMNSAEIMAHEFGHRWIAFTDVDPAAMLGRGPHWSFLMNSMGSVMLGNEILDRGGGRFLTLRPTYRFSPLDQYLMGLRSPAEVSPWFVVENARLTPDPGSPIICSEFGKDCPPWEGIPFEGTRRELTIEQVIAAAGPRVPDVAGSRKDFAAAFLVVTLPGQGVSDFSFDKLDRIRRAFQDSFPTVVEGRATMSTGLNPPVTDLTLDVPVGGSVAVETTAGDDVNVGYGRVAGGTGVAIIKSLSSGALSAAAAVPASRTARRWRVPAEKDGSVSTALAIANPNPVPASLLLTLGGGSTAAFDIPANGQRAAFLDELIETIDPLVFDLLTIDSDVPIALTVLRSTLNTDGKFVMASVPGAMDGDSVEGGAFPWIVAGGGYNTEMVLWNSGTEVAEGTIDLSFVVATDAGDGDGFPFSIPPGGVFRLRTSRPGSAGLSTGYATIHTFGGQAGITGTAFLRLSEGEALVSETAVPAQEKVTAAAAFASTHPDRRTGLAVLNPGASPAVLTLQARDRLGNASGAEATLTLPGGELRSAFFDEWIPGLGPAFDGTVELRSTDALHAISIRLVIDGDGRPIMVALPILELPIVEGPFYFPQIVQGSSFRTELLLVGSDGRMIDLDFFTATGSPLALPWR